MRWILACAVFVPGAALAAPGPTHVAETTADLDRDGAADAIRLSWTEVEVALGAGGGDVLRFPVGRIERGAIAADGRWIVAQLGTAAGLEAVALEYRAGALR